MPPSLTIATSPTDVDNFVSTTRPEFYFPEVFKYAPMKVRSRAMMTLFIAANKNERRIDDALFHFYQKPWNQRDCAVIDVYDGPGLTNATTTSTSGVTRNIALTATNAKLWEVGMHVVVTKFADSGYKQVSGKCVGKVSGKTVGDDTTSYITITTKESDTDTALAGTYIRINPAGQSHPNVHTLPESHVEQVTKYDGACSTFLGSYSMTDHARLTNLRINVDPFTEAEQDGLKDFAIDKETAFMESVLDTSTPTELVTGGMDYYLRNYQAATGRNIIDALTDTTYLGSVTGPAYTWIYDLLEGVSEYAARWQGAGELRAYHGGMAGIVINRMIRDKTVANLGMSQDIDEYGFEFSRLKFQNGSIRFYPHPLMANAARYQGSIWIPNMENITQTTFMPFETIPADVMNEERAKRARRDGTVWSSVAKGGFREVCGWKFNAIDGMFIINNVHPDLSRS